MPIGQSILTRTSANGGQALPFFLHCPRTARQHQNLQQYQHQNLQQYRLGWQRTGHFPGIPEVLRPFGRCGGLRPVSFSLSPPRNSFAPSLPCAQRSFTSLSARPCKRRGYDRDASLSSSSTALSYRQAAGTTLPQRVQAGRCWRTRALEVGRPRGGLANAAL